MEAELYMRVVQACAVNLPHSPAICFIITGYPGSGKELLLQRLLQYARERGHDVLSTNDKRHKPEQNGRGESGLQPAFLFSSASTALGGASAARIVGCDDEEDAADHKAERRKQVCTIVVDLRRTAMIADSLFSGPSSSSHAHLASLLRRSACVVATLSSMLEVPEWLRSELGIEPIEIPCSSLLCAVMATSGQESGIEASGTSSPREIALLAGFCRGQLATDISPGRRHQLIAGIRHAARGGSVDNTQDVTKVIHGATAVPPPTLYGLDDVLSRVTMLLSIHQKRHALVGGEVNVESESPHCGGLLGLAPTTTGILLTGPSGSGKSAIMKALPSLLPAVPFLSISAQRLFSKFFGESEAKLREAFAAARRHQPCVVLIDDIEVLAPRRHVEATEGGGGGTGLSVGRRMLAALLCEMDGLADSSGILVVAATSAPQLLDRALLRQGRLETILDLPLPSAENLRTYATSLADRFGSGGDAGPEQEASDQRRREELVSCATGVCGGLPASFVEYFFSLVVELQLREQFLCPGFLPAASHGRLALPSQAVIALASSAVMNRQR